MGITKMPQARGFFLLFFALQGDSYDKKTGCLYYYFLRVIFLFRRNRPCSFWNDYSFRLNGNAG